MSDLKVSLTLSADGKQLVGKLKGGKPVECQFR